MFHLFASQSIRCLTVLSLLLISSVNAATFVVNSAENFADGIPGNGVCDTSADPMMPSGDCTLRAAVQEANATATQDTINFAIGNGAATIMVNAVIEITEPVIINGTSQPGFAGDPLIELSHDGGGAFPGLSLMGNDSIIRGLTINSFPVDGVAIFGDRNEIRGCWIGLDATGTMRADNLRGIGIGGDANVIGGNLPGDRNVISGNFDGGVVIGTGGSNTQVINNWLGLSADGITAIDNGFVGAGIRVDGTNDRIGPNNVASGNTIGIQVQGTDSVVFDNRVGTDPAGTGSVPNTFAGILVAFANNIQIGGRRNTGSVVPDSRTGKGVMVGGNVVSGNAGDGIQVGGSTNVSIVGNLVGTDVTGDLPLGNGEHGIHVLSRSAINSSNIDIGLLPLPPVAPPGLFGNVVASNGDSPTGGHGIFIEDGSSNVDVLRNFVGTDDNATEMLGNADDGVRIQESFNNLVDLNTIIFNGGAGVSVVDLDTLPADQNTLSNVVFNNRTRDNGGLGIDLTIGGPVLDGVTVNDAGDADIGPNDFQNFPVITDLSQGATTSTISGTLSSRPLRDYTVLVFSSETCDPSGHGEGDNALGTAQIVTDGNGDANFTVMTTETPEVLTALVVDDVNEDASELSECFDPFNGGVIGNRVWEDQDGDGLQGQGEPGVAGVPVRLLTAGMAEVDTTVSDQNGIYQFTGVASGDYIVEFSPESAIFTTADASPNDAIDSDVIDVDGRTDVFTYTAGTIDRTRDAGVILDGIFSDGFEAGSTAKLSFR